MIQRHVKARVRKSWESVRRFVVHEILHADDPPHRLALGIAIGMFVTFLPLMGIQMVTVVFLAWLLRANKVVGVPLVWISNPATFVPIYYSCYLVGRLILGYDGVGSAWWEELAHPPSGVGTTITFYWSRLLEIAVPLWLGCTVVGSIVAYPVYYLVYHVVRFYRLRRWGQLVPPAPAAGEPQPSEACAATTARPPQVESSAP